MKFGAPQQIPIDDDITLVEREVNCGPLLKSDGIPARGPLLGAGLELARVT